METVTRQKSRIVYLDEVSGILITYMIFMHCCQFTLMEDCYFCKVLSVVFSCFMGWFFYKSGMFHKESANVKNMFLHTVKKLWKPYILFWCTGFALNACCLYFDGDGNWKHYILSPIKQTLWDGGTNAGELPMWFLCTLVAVKTVSPIILKYRQVGVIACGLIGLALCIICKRYEYGALHPYYFMNFFPAMFFYGMGYYLKAKQFRMRLFIAALCVYILSFAYPSIVDFRVNTLVCGDMPLWYVYAPSGIIVFNFIANRVSINLYPITAIGQNSMYWFLMHWPILIIVNRISNNYYSGGGKLLIIVFSSVIVTLTLSRPMIRRTVLGRWI